jgi:hypothetical protein
VDYQTLVLSVAGIVGPIILACGAFFTRKRVYANWAKTAYIIASLAGGLGYSWFCRLAASACEPREVGFPSPH